MTGGVIAAVDLGASSGRVVLGHVSPDKLRLDEVHRFGNGPVTRPDGLHWDIEGLYRETVEGLRLAGRAAAVDGGLVSIGIDSWAVDHGFLDPSGALLGMPYHYRDERTARGVQDVHARVPFERLYARNGLQFLPFTSIYQLAASQREPWFADARTMLLIPDLIGWWLTGRAVAERTNASTTGLLDAQTQGWARDLIATLELSLTLFPELADPGTVLGPLRPTVRDETGLGDLPVTLVGSHDTASAVVGVPLDDDAAYVSCGTWALVGVELDAPILTDASRLANFTNEGGVDGRVRYLRNVMGLWILSESLRTWDLEGTPGRLDALLDAADALPAGGPVFDPDDPAFLPPGDMPARISDLLVRNGQPVPTTRPAMVRSILESLAAAFARAVGEAARLSGRRIRAIHMVGGGSRNDLLCRLTADATGLPVVAGPVEATAIGNLLIQARSHGLVSGDLETLRALIRLTQPLRRYEPSRRSTPVA